MRLVPKLVGSLKLMGIVETKGFDITADAMPKHRRASQNISKESTQSLNIDMAIRRLSHCCETCLNQYARKWYNQKLSELNGRNPTTASVPTAAHSSLSRDVARNSHIPNQTTPPKEPVADDWTIVGPRSQRSAKNKTQTDPHWREAQRQQPDTDPPPEPESPNSPEPKDIPMEKRTTSQEVNHPMLAKPVRRGSPSPVPWTRKFLQERR